MAGPKMVAAPPTTTATRMVMDRSGPNSFASTCDELTTSSAPPMPASMALKPKVSTLYTARFTPTTSAAVSLSRMAMSARPTRLFTRLRTTTNATTTITRIT
jgi:hypothetical protein